MPDYPVQNRLTQALRAESTRADNPDMISLWAGQGVSLASAAPAALLIERWWAEARAASAELAVRVEPRVTT